MKDIGIILILCSGLLGSEFALPIEEKTLNNGLKVIVVEDHTNPLVTVQVWYRVGSRNEYNGITGISHLLEHMMFKGTKKLKAEEFSEMIQRVGGYDNAFTSEDVTGYHEVVPASKLEMLLQMEADRMTNAVFREFDAEREVVKEERRWRDENDPWGILYENLRAAAFIAHTYHNPIVGWMSDLNNLRLEDIQNYYNLYYSPQNAYLIIAGDVEREKAFQLAEKYFGRIKNKIRETNPITQEPEQHGERRVTIKKEGFVSLLGIVYHVPQFTHEDFPALYLTTKILGDGKSSRLYKACVYEKSLATMIMPWIDRGIDPGLLYVFASLQQGVNPNDLEASIYEEIDRLQQTPVGEDELTKVINKAIIEFVRQCEDTEGKGSVTAEFAVLDTPTSANQWIAKLKMVTPLDIQKIAQKYLTPTSRTVAILEPIPPENPEEYFQKLQESKKPER